jgi:hypothetical protein
MSESRSTPPEANTYPATPYPATPLGITLKIALVGVYWFVWAVLGSVK